MFDDPTDLRDVGEPSRTAQHAQKWFAFFLETERTLSSSTIVITDFSELRDDQQLASLNSGERDTGGAAFKSQVALERRKYH